MPDSPSPFVPADCLPGLPDDYADWYGQEICNRACPGRSEYYDEYDTRIPADRDFLSRVAARWLGVPVGATAPKWHRREWALGDDVDGLDVWYLTGRDGYPVAFGKRIHTCLSSIPPDSPDRDALALAAVVRWLGEEVRAGRIQPPEVTREP